MRPLCASGLDSQRRLSHLLSQVLCDGFPVPLRYKGFLRTRGIYGIDYWLLAHILSLLPMFYCPI